MSDKLTARDIETLKAPFPDETIGVKVQSVNKDKNKALLVLYVQHTDAMNRIEEVDPEWSAEILLASKEVGTDFHGKATSYCSLRLKLTVKGISREDYGEGDESKGALSDALKRCAMRFGVGRYLYDETPKWVPYNEATDKYRAWTFADYSSDKKPVPVKRTPSIPSIADIAAQKAAPFKIPPQTYDDRNPPPPSDEHMRDILSLMNVERVQVFPDDIVGRPDPLPRIPGPAPECCGKKMMQSIYMSDPDVDYWYCKNCRKKQGR